MEPKMNIEILTDAQKRLDRLMFEPKSPVDEAIIASLSAVIEILRSQYAAPQTPYPPQVIVSA